MHLQCRNGHAEFSLRAARGSIYASCTAADCEEVYELRGAEVI